MRNYIYIYIYIVHYIFWCILDACHTYFETSCKTTFRLKIVLLLSFYLVQFYVIIIQHTLLPANLSKHAVSNNNNKHQHAVSTWYPEVARLCQNWIPHFWNFYQYSAWFVKSITMWHFFVETKNFVCLFVFNFFFGGSLLTDWLPWPGAMIKTNRP